jgi:hypothetical protein
VLVNTIGTFHPGEALTATPEDLRLMLDVNLGAALWLTQAVAPYMRGRGSGAIVHVSARPGSEPTAGMAAYSVSKAALNHLVRVLDLELRPLGIRVNAVAPQLLDTATAARSSPAARRSRPSPRSPPWPTAPRRTGVRRRRHAARLRADPAVRARPGRQRAGLLRRAGRAEPVLGHRRHLPGGVPDHPDGVVLFDAPPTIGHNLQRAIDEIAAANGVSNKVTHIVYSHHHADHLGASSLFGRTWCGSATPRQAAAGPGQRPDPAAARRHLRDRYTLRVGGERSTWPGTAPTTRRTTSTSTSPTTTRSCWSTSTCPAGCRSTASTSTRTSRLHRRPGQGLSYPWKHFIGGHMGRLGTRTTWSSTSST